MTTLRQLLWLVLIFALAVPPAPAAAMITENAAEDNAEGTGENRRPQGRGAEAAQRDEALAARTADANRLRLRNALNASVALAFLEADPADAEALRDALTDPAAFAAPLPAADVNAMLASAASERAASSASTSTSASAAASADTRGGAEKLRRGTATDLSATAAKARVARGEPAQVPPGREADLPPPDLGRNRRDNHETLLRDLLADAVAGEKFNLPGAAAANRARVATALVAANATLPSLRAPQVGRMPVDLARALVEISAQPDGETIVRSYASAERGVETANLPDEFSADPIRRVAALDTLIRTASDAARDYEKGNALRDRLNALARDTQADRDALARYLNDTLANYPQALATTQLEPGQLLSPVGVGANAKPSGLRYDFRTGKVRESGPVLAVFKPSEATVKADGGLGNTGVAINTSEPMRLEQRAIATRRVAEALRIGELVVNARVALLAGDTPTLGLLMEAAPGRPGLEATRRVDPPAQDLQHFIGLETQRNEVDRMITFIESGLQFNRPVTPSVTAPEKDSWTLEQWQAHKAALEQEMDNSIVRKAPINGRMAYFSLIQERTVTDADLQDPDLRRQLSNAQWLDLLCGQVDRHMGNAMFDTAARPPVMKLIDNDMSFGPNNAAYGLDDAARTPRFRLPPKPKAIDAGLRKAFLELTPEKLRSVTHGLLTQAEQDGLAGRLTMLQGYIREGGVLAIYPAGQAPTGQRSWASNPATLFIGHDRNDIDPSGGDFSYYSILKSLPERGR